MTDEQNIEDDIPKLESPIKKENEFILGDYRIKIQMIEAMDSSTNENEILMSIEDIRDTELFVYEKKLNYEEFKASGELFSRFCCNIEDVYDLLSNLFENNSTENEDDGIKIEEINHGNSINISMKSTIEILRRTISANIELLKKKYK